MSGVSFPPRPDLQDVKSPEWVVMRVAPRRWRVWIQHGPFRIGPDGMWWTRMTQGNAIAKGMRELQRYKKQSNYGGEVVRGNE